MTDWTRGMVEDRLIEAADVMKRLPAVRAKGYFSAWPTILPEFSDLVGREPPRLRRPPPSPKAITRAEEAMLWLRWLELDDARLVWMRAEGARWREICERFGVVRATACRRWEYALWVIAWRLDGRPLPKTWSRERLIERARATKREA